MKILSDISLMYVFLLASILFCACNNNSQNAVDSNIKIAEQDIDFGNITFGIPTEYKLRYTNSGSEALSIINIVTSCECTTFVWDKKPVSPGEEGSILITYSPKYHGHFKESVRLFTDSSRDSTIQLTIKGRVIES